MQRVIKCDKCQQNFTQQWIAAKKQWSQINQVVYWTKHKWKNYQFFCRSCLNNWYEKDWETFKKLVEPKKRKLFAGYRSYGLFSKNDLTSYQPLELFNKNLALESSKSTQKTCRHCSSFPLSLKVKCFRCQKDFFIKYVIPRKDYSQKNSWSYWTEQKGNHKICDACLRVFYYDKLIYWAVVKDPKRRQKMRVYIHEGIIKKS